jgi:hypothetical protein
MVLLRLASSVGETRLCTGSGNASIRVKKANMVELTRHNRVNSTMFMFFIRRIRAIEKFLCIYD